MKRGRMPRAETCLVIVLMWLAAPLAAQDKPDFSGSWVLESIAQAAEDIPRALSVSQSIVRTNVRGDAMTPFFKDITVTRALDSGTRSETFQIGVAGGTVSGRADGSANRPRTHHRVEWEEQALIIESGRYTGPTPESGEWTERREVWSLDSGGRLRLSITTRSSVAAARSVILAYRRQ